MATRTEAYLKEGSIPQTIKYAHSAAVAAGEVLWVAGIGIVIASEVGDANESIVYYKRGLFQFPITTGVTVTQGAKCYWDVSANTVILSSSTSLLATDPYLGRAAAAGTAAGGYVNIDINQAVDYLATGGTLPDAVIVDIGTHVCTAALDQVVLATTVASTDRAFAQMCSYAALTTVIIQKIVTGDGSITVSLNDVPTSGAFYWKAVRAV